MVIYDSRLTDKYIAVTRARMLTGKRSEAVRGVAHVLSISVADAVKEVSKIMGGVTDATKRA